VGRQRFFRWKTFGFLWVVLWRERAVELKSFLPASESRQSNIPSASRPHTEIGTRRNASCDPSNPHGALLRLEDNTSSDGSASGRRRSQSGARSLGGCVYIDWVISAACLATVA